MSELQIQTKTGKYNYYIHVFVVVVFFCFLVFCLVFCWVFFLYFGGFFHDR